MEFLAVFGLERVEFGPRERHFVELTLDCTTIEFTIHFHLEVVEFLVDLRLEVVPKGFSFLSDALLI